MWRSSRRFSSLALIGVFALAGCSAQPAPTSPAAGGGNTSATSSAPRQSKTLTIGVQQDFANLATPLDVVGGAALPTRFFHQFLNSYLTVRNGNNEPTALLATQLPSLDDGTWKVSDDGTMEVTWHLRQGVKWHDGQELTSDDVRFGYEVAIDTNTPIGARSPTRMVDRFDTPDAYTFVMHWTATSQNGNELGERELDVLPRHILGEAFKSDPTSLPTNPWVNQPEAFVGLGPYRPVEWVRNSQLTTEAFDQYFMGRPKIDRVIFKPITDAQAMLANVLAGSVDLVYQSLSLDGAKVIQQQWAQNNGGTVLLRPTNLEHILPEFRPEFAKPADILDVRMRRALAHGLNKEDVADAVGVPRELVADSVALPGTPEGDAVAKGLARYPYDPARASALLQEMGWQRGADGMLTRNDQPLQIEMRAGTTEGPALFTVAQQGYKQIGIDLVSVAVAGATDPQAEAQFSAISISSIPVTPLISWSNRWHSRQISGPANRYAGTNLEGYSSAVTDQAIVNLERALRRDDQLRYWTDVWRQISDDVGVIPVHFIPQPSVARRGVTGWVTPNLLGEPAYAPWTWDIS